MPDQLVECGDHGRSRGYGVCKHVLKGTPPTHVEPATVQAIGILSCDECAIPPQKVSNFVLVCEGCVRKKGFLLQ